MGQENKNQFIDGVDNTAYWSGASDKSARDAILHYYESRITALRIGPWKYHFATKEDYTGNMTMRSFPLIFNIRMDPFESYDDDHLLQRCPDERAGERGDRGASADAGGLSAGAGRQDHEMADLVQGLLAKAATDALACGIHRRRPSRLSENDHDPTRRHAAAPGPRIRCRA